MAIDTSLFGANVPAGTYTKGDQIQLKNIAGPAIVRAGRGNAILKRITSGIIANASGSVSFWRIDIKNSDWIDPASNITGPMWDASIFDERSGSVQRGHDMPLLPNSSWTVTATCLKTVTTTVDNSIFCLIDIDYPSVSSITDPDILQGYPTSITQEKGTIAYQKPSIESAIWTTDNVDIFKAGYQYALAKTEMLSSSVAGVGFVALANAAGMGGLMRIMPITALATAIRNKVEYATKLVKGPMDIKYMLFNDAGTATTGDLSFIMDFVKRQV